MNKNQKTKEKICTFYASDYHFEMISLPYINTKINENKEIIILTENNLDKTLTKLISNLNLNNENKNKILNLNWKNDDVNKLKKISEIIDSNKEIIVFVKGKEEYIKNINNNLKKWTNKSENIKIIDCYEIEEVSNKMDNLINNYSKVLNTKGENNIAI